MALIVEDGTAKSDAESYLSVADASTYHDNHHNMEWFNFTDDEKERFLRLGTQYLDINFGRRWNGTPNKSTQALDWPRVGANDYAGNLFESDELPQSLLDATAEISLSASKSDLFDLQTTQTQAGVIEAERVKVGSLEVETKYSGGATQEKTYTKVSSLIRELIGNFGKVQRG